MNSGSIKNEQRYVAMSWCLNNDIFIYFQPINNIEGKIIIEEKGNKFVSDETYRNDNKLVRRKRKKGEPPKKTYSERIYELYIIKYNEYYEEREQHS